MRVSVLISVYNGERTIRATVESVLAQAVAPDEILVLNDGSNDNTLAILNSYQPRITVLSQPNAGISSARNALCRCAKGNLIAFLDADDIWHPQYIGKLRRIFHKHPGAIASYIGHVNFYGYGDYKWDSRSAKESDETEVIAPLDFLIRYNRSTGNFGSMSYCCVRASVLGSLGDNPFRNDGVEDSYLSCGLALLGPVIYAPAPLVAYRITPESLSADHLRSYGRWVNVFELMSPQYKACGDRSLIRAFKRAFASKRRVYSKMLMAAHRPSEAREQLRRSLKDSGDPASVAKSLAILSMTHLPAPLHPKWPSGNRERTGTN